MKEPEAITILIVDEDLSHLALLKAVMEGEGFAAVVASGAVQAVGILNTRKDIRAVLSDLEMPLRSGVWLLITIRALGIQVPFLILTQNKKFTEEAGRAAGIAKVLYKPTDPVAVAAAVRAAIADADGLRR